jgi:hypothetical protein
MDFMKVINLLNINGIYILIQMSPRTIMMMIGILMKLFLTQRSHLNVNTVLKTSVISRTIRIFKLVLELLRL